MVLAIDELPILVNRLLKDDNDRITPEGKQEADAFLSWLRKNGQEHRERVSIILSGSVGLEPILEQAGLSAQANIFSTFDLKPWDESTAVSCLEHLSETYCIVLPLNVRRYMCRKLRCCIPHHVQMFFDKIHHHMKREDLQEASLNDVDWVYQHEMLSVRGQVDMQHYQSRLKTILGKTGYPIALEILTYIAIGGCLDDEAVRRYEKYFATQHEEGTPSVEDVLRLLQHNGYLELLEDRTSQFASGLLEDWRSNRYGGNFKPVVGPLHSSRK